MNSFLKFLQEVEENPVGTTSPIENVEEMQIRNSLKIALQRLFHQMGKVTLTRQRAMEIMGEIMDEMSQEFNLTPTHLKTAIRGMHDEPNP